MKIKCTVCEAVKTDDHFCKNCYLCLECCECITIQIPSKEEDSICGCYGCTTMRGPCSYSRDSFTETLADA